MRDNIEVGGHSGSFSEGHRTIVTKWFDDNFSDDGFAMYTTTPAAVVESVVEILDTPREDLILRAQAGRDDAKLPLRELVAELAVNIMYAKFAERGIKRESVAGHVSSTKSAVRALF